ncbi:MAG: hypothetical protein GXO75_18375 [Calditrichaeota bacterium]|nr:hypothetical protein [Calditrichota bacterium]
MGRKKLKWSFKLGLLFLFILILWLVHKPIFIAMGRYLEMPSSNHPADVVVIEGGHTVSRFRVEEAIRLWREGTIKHIVMTLNTQNGLVDAFGLQNYQQIVRTKMDSLHVPPSAYTIMKLNITDPFTHNTAKALLQYMLGHNYHSLMIIHDNFHIRRSYLAYKKVMEKHGISIYPHTVRIYIDATNWWQAANGVRRVYAEYIKLLFYWYKGYL